MKPSLPVALIAPLLLSFMAVSVSFLGDSQAAGTGTEGSLTWSQCLSLAAKNSPDLKAAKSALQSAEAKVAAARSGFLPELSASLGARQADATSGTLGTTYSSSLDLSQNLFNGFADQARVDAAKIQRDIARLNLHIARAKISSDLRIAFSRLLYTEKMASLAREIIKRREVNLRSVELRYESGRENKGSVLLSRAYLDEARLELTKIMNQQSTAAAELARLIGEGMESLRVTGELPIEEPAKEPLYPEIARETPEYLLQEAQEKIAEVSVDEARSGFFPTLKASGSYYGSGSDFQNQPNRWSAALTLTFPILDGGKDFYGVRAAKQNLVSARLTRESKRLEMIAKLKQAWSAWSEAAAAVRIQGSHVRAAQVRASIGRQKYNNGLLSFDQWDLIENDLIDREKKLNNGLRDRWLAEAQWKQILGVYEPLFE